MAKLAIKGHATRGSEVIEILEMLGGKNKISSDGERCFLGSDDKYYYTIEEDNNIAICCRHNYEKTIKYRRFSLEEFLDKYPYKIGDKVICNISIPRNITGMKWDGKQVLYSCDKEHLSWYCAEKIDKAEETIEEKKINQMSLANCELDEVEIVLGDKFEMVFKAGKWYAIRKKPKYPKTHEECCRILGSDPKKIIVLSNREKITHKENKYCFGMYNLYQLLICRDAYWKIEGNWAPDWINSYQKKWTISFYQGEISLSNTPNVHRLLAFPTEEMRDAFYDNFKELIEECKELL